MRARVDNPRPSFFVLSQSSIRQRDNKSAFASLILVGAAAKKSAKNRVTHRLQRYFFYSGDGTSACRQCFKKAIKSDICCGVMSFSRPSGINDKPVDRISSISSRNKVVDLPSSCLIVIDVDVSDARIQLNTWPLTVNTV